MGKRKWTFKRATTASRPTISMELAQVIHRMAREHNGWGDAYIERDLLKPGYQRDRSTVRHVLKQDRRPHAPKRRLGTG